MKINILTLFPEMFNGVFTYSILGRAREKGILDINILNIRDFTLDKAKKVDDTPYGGGAGMVMFCQPIFSALEKIYGLEGKSKNKKILYMSPRGKVINENILRDLAVEEEITILCGHYEGVDQRVLEYWDMEEVSIGDYVLTGGELPAMVLVDSMSRFIPDVLGTMESATEESIYSGLLEYDQYTKPFDFKGLKVPEVLKGGNHKAIKLWRLENSIRRTAKFRRDLLDKWKINKTGTEDLTKKEKNNIEKILMEL